MIGQTGLAFRSTSCTIETQYVRRRYGGVYGSCCARASYTASFPEPRPPCLRSSPQCQSPFLYAFRAVHEVRHLEVPCGPSCCATEKSSRSRGADEPPIHPRELQRNEQVHDEVARAQGVQRAERVELVVCAAGLRDVRALGVRDEMVDADVVRADKGDDAGWRSSRSHVAWCAMSS